MSWTWRLESDGDARIDQADVPTFDSQADAETWIGDEWARLLELGVDSVSLVEGDRVEYANMSLHPPADE